MPVDDATLPSSYLGLMVQLAQDAETLTLHGNALRLLGPLAPPCLVRPYNEYRRKIITAAEELFSSYQRTNGAELTAEFVERSKAFLLMLDGMPELIGSWSDAPAVWQPEAFGDPGGGGTVEERSSVGKLGSEIENWLRDSLRPAAPYGPLPAELAATEAVAAQGFWRGVWTAGRGVAGFAAKHWVGLWLAWDVSDWLSDGISGVVETALRPVSEPAVIDLITEAIRSVELDYLPRTAQQWQAVIKITRAAHANRAIMRKLMAAYDPHTEKPLPPQPSAFDVFKLGDLAGLQTLGGKKSWIAIPVLVGGSIASAIAVRE